MLLSDLLSAFLAVPPHLDCEISGISDDSRNLGENDLWLAAQGTQKHALDYEINQMPKAIVYESPYENPPSEALPVANLSKYISEIAARFYDYPSKKLTTIGVTGTDGKSSLVHLLAQATGEAMLGTIGNGRLNDLQTSTHTTASPVEVQKNLHNFVEQGIKIVAMEVSSHALSQNRVAAIQFDTVLFTNLSRDHLDYHKDMDDYFYSKAKIFQQTKYALVHLDNAYSKRLLQENLIPKNTILFTISSQSEALPAESEQHFYAKNIKFLAQGLRFTLGRITKTGHKEESLVESALLARFNIDNLLNCAAVLATLNWDFARIISALEKLKPVKGRAQLIELANGAAAVIDYAHTPAALANILQGIRPHVQGKLFCLFGCGGNRDKGKRPQMGEMAKKYADEIILSDDNPRDENPAEIIKDIQLPQATVIQPREKAIHEALQKLKKGDILVIAGKGHEDYQIIKGQKFHFSDAEIVQSFNKAL